jgi:hypothetical protein
VGVRALGLLAGGALLLAVLAAGAAYPEHAAAAPCGPTVVTGTTDLRIEGDPSVGGCGEDGETFSVFCSGGTVRFDYYVNGSFASTVDTGVACSTPNRITVDGYFGGDFIDLTRVSQANGFTAINQPNRLLGSFGNDVLYGSPFSDSFLGSVESDFLFARDAGTDSVDCGTEFDYAQVDKQGVDSIAGCEFTDFLPTPTAPAAASAAPATPAAKKCKRKKSKKRKCKRGRQR